MSLIKLLSKLSPVRPQQVAAAPKVLAQADQLKGGLQQLGPLLNQLKGKPGVKQADLAMWQHLDPKMKVQAKDLGSLARGSKLYAQRGFGRNSEEQAHELAMDMIYGPEMEQQRSRMYMDLLDEVMDDIVDPDDVDVRRIGKLRAQFQRAQSNGTGLPAGWEDQARDIVDNNHRMGEEAVYEAMHDLMPEAMEIAQRDLPRSGGPQFAAYQRQPLAKQLEDAGGEYFETVLRREPSYERGLKQRLTPGEWASYHFNNPSQLGHVRGTASPGGQKLIIEEIQSDPVEQLGEKYPGMENIYGKLGTMVMDRAAAADVPVVMVPDAKRIASVRGGDKSGFMEKLYDRELDKVLYSPLQELGVPVYSDNGWMNIELSPQVRKRILEGNMLKFGAGGRVLGALNQLLNATRTASKRK